MKYIRWMTCLSMALSLAGCSLFGERDGASSEEVDEPEQVEESEPNDAFDSATVVSSALPSVGELTEGDEDWLRPLEGRTLQVELDGAVRVSLVRQDGLRAELRGDAAETLSLSLPSDEWALVLSGSGQWSALTPEEPAETDCGLRAPEGYELLLVSGPRARVELCVRTAPQRVLWMPRSGDAPGAFEEIDGAGFTVDIATDVIVEGRVQLRAAGEDVYGYTLPRNPDRAPFLRLPDERGPLSLLLEIAKPGVMEESVEVSLEPLPAQPEDRLVSLEPDDNVEAAPILRPGQHLLGQFQNTEDNDFFAIVGAEPRSFATLRVSAQNVESFRLATLDEEGELSGTHYDSSDERSTIELCAIPLSDEEPTYYRLSPTRIADESEGGYRVDLVSLDQAIDEVEPNDEPGEPPASAASVRAEEAWPPADNRNVPTPTERTEQVVVQPVFYPGGDEQTIRGIVQEGGDTDIYWLEVLPSSADVPLTIALRPQGPVDLSLRLLDEDRIPVAASDSGGSGSTEALTVPLPPGFYMVEVSGTNIAPCEGFYSISLQGRAPDGDRPDDALPGEGNGSLQRDAPSQEQNRRAPPSLDDTPPPLLREAEEADVSP